MVLIDDKIRKALRELAEKKGSVLALSKEFDVAHTTLGAWIEGKTKSVKDSVFVRIMRMITRQKIMTEEELQQYSLLLHSARLTALENYNNNPSPNIPNTIANTPQLRECIKDAMMREGLTSSDDLTRAIGYDSKNTIDRLLSGKLAFSPDVLGAILDHLGISHDEAPVSNTERLMLPEEGLYNAGAVLIRPIPVVDWANAAGYISMIAGGGVTMNHWNPETTETVAAPVGSRKDTQAFRVSGQSMEPIILDNDILFCEPQASLDDIPNGKIVVLKFSDCAKFSDCVVCKRYRRIGEKILLTSENSILGHDFEISPEEIGWIGLVTSKNSKL